MGEPVKIVELAKTMIRLAGRGEHDIAIVFTGLRPGEKLYEELLADKDISVATAVARLRVAKIREAARLDLLLPGLAMVAAIDGPPGRTDPRRLLLEMVPEYQPLEGR